MGRLTQVTKDGNLLRTYGYDAYGNRTRMTEGDRETAYTYNAMNQLMSRVDAGNEETYTYDRRGNLSLIMENGTMKNSYTYGALNRLEQAVNGKGEAAAYEYNGLGHRVGKTITPAAEPTPPDPLGRQNQQPPDPETKIRYTIDLTRGYHNLLQKEEAGTIQTYLWDGNVAGMKEEGREGNGLTARSNQPGTCYYFQDELGSPVRLINEEGTLRETYGYDEFGQDLYGNQGAAQPFGYTGYQSDRTAETWYAQAREYRAELGRFAGRDIIKGYTAAPYTLNEYGYCWNNPMVLVDRDGAWPEWMEDAGETIIDVYDWAVDGYNNWAEDMNGTATIKISANATALLGVYVDIGVSVDWKGNVALQWSYSVPGVDDTASVGVVDIGAALGVAFTDAENVNGLLGKSSTIGASGGYLGYAALDTISFEEMEDMNGDIDGVQIGAGLGVGIDIHMMESYTREIHSYNTFQVIRSVLDFVFGKKDNLECIQ